MRKNNNLKTLSLNLNTVRPLDASDLTQAAGGGKVISGTTACGGPSQLIRCPM